MESTTITFVPNASGTITSTEVNNQLSIKFGNTYIAEFKNFQQIIEGTPRGNATDKAINETINR